LKAPQRRRVRFRLLVLGKMLRKHAASPQAIPPLVYAIEFMADFNPVARRPGALAALAALQQNPVAFR
jgi:hypothetical protein